ncbi:MAG: hypothetical protein M3Y85_00285, partial [Bacteroidota bacterium]|nr:hypothetical protein [Bacteroidota bacterium]
MHTKPQVAITKIDIGEKVFQKDSAFLCNHTIKVAYDNNDFYFGFAALDYTRPEANKIKYKLEGWDVGWVTTMS